MGRVLIKGTEIFCPSCKHHIATVKNDILSGEILKISSFDFKDKEPLTRSKLVCSQCSTSYADNKSGFIRIHTKDGWK